MTEQEITEKIASELCKQCPGMIQDCQVNDHHIYFMVPVSFDGDVEECIKDFMKKNLGNFDRIEVSEQKEWEGLLTYYNSNTNICITVTIDQIDEDTVEKIKAELYIGVSKAFIPSDQYVIVK